MPHQRCTASAQINGSIFKLYHHVHIFSTHGIEKIYIKIIYLQMGRIIAVLNHLSYISNIYGKFYIFFYSMQVYMYTYGQYSLFNAI